MRIVSLLPSTTEIVAALNRGSQLVGRSHECDYPAEVSSLPSCTEPKFEARGTSYEIDQRVKALLQEGLSVYRVDEEKLAEVEPDLIITQDHCEVCAATVDEVRQAVRDRLGSHVEVISVSPTDLSSVIQSIRTIANAINAEQAAEELTEQMKNRFQHIQDRASQLHRPDILGIEWMDPLMSAGNWVPELMIIAGGNPLHAEAGQHSPTLQWETIRRTDPDIITIMPCGYSIEESLGQIGSLTSREGWDQLEAVRNRQVFILDGNQYFNRPGPRLLDSTQILAEILHPAAFRWNSSPHPGWINFYKHRFRQNLGN